MGHARCRCRRGSEVLGYRTVLRVNVGTPTGGLRVGVCTLHGVLAHQVLAKLGGVFTHGLHCDERFRSVSSLKRRKT
eukprot:725812-Prymnesium_polylepis.1